MNHIFTEKFEAIETLNQFIDFIAHHYGDNTAISQLRNGIFEKISFKELKLKSETMARFLISKGISSQDNIVLLSESRLESPEIAFGILLSGATLVPLDIKLTEYELSNLINHSEPKLIFYSKSLEVLLKKAKSLTNHSFAALLIDQLNIPELNHQQIPAFDHNRMNILVYTSGTAGAPKGVMTRLAAVLFEAKASGAMLYTGKKEVFLSMLPLNHLFEFTAGLCTTLITGAEVCFSNSIEKDHLMECMVKRHVTQMVTVPLFITNLKKGIERNVNQGPAVKKFLFHTLLFLCKIIAIDSFRRKLFKSLHDKMGGKLYRFIIGSAAVPREVIEFFNQVGINVYEGYGLSETGPIISTNTVDHYKVGSVGVALKGVQVKLKDDEILTKGKHLMIGYYKNPELTQEAFDEEGWFKTGDIGKIDKDGFIFITGRKKKLIVFDGGKKVHPEEIECLLANDSMVKEVAVVGRKTEENAINDAYIVAVLVPADELMQTYNNDWEQVEKIMVNRAKELTKMLAEFKRPTEFLIFKDELPKTTTRKVKAHEVSNMVQMHYKNNPEQNIFQ